MCFNKEVSLVTFIFGLLASIKLFTIKTDETPEGKKLANSYKAAGIFVFFTNLMQLNEFFLWIFQDTKTLTHQILSICICMVLILQAVSFYSVCMEYGIFKGTDFQTASTVIFSISMFTFIFVLYSGYKHFWKMKSIPTEGSCRMHWDIYSKFMKDFPIMFWINFLSYLGIVMLCTYAIFRVEIFYLLMALMIAIFLYYRFSSRKNIKNFTASWASVWCFSVIFFSSIIFLFADSCSGQVIVNQ